MTKPRFYLSEHGVMLDTPVPLSQHQRFAVAQFAIKEYKRRIKSLTGTKREVMASVIEAIMANNFIERPIPAHDYEEEALIYG